MVDILSSLTINAGQGKNCFLGKKIPYNYKIQIWLRKWNATTKIEVNANYILQIGSLICHTISLYAIYVPYIVNVQVYNARICFIKSLISVIYKNEYLVAL